MRTPSIVPKEPVNELHTEESVRVETDFPFYNKWREIVIGKGKIEWLINVREKHPA